MFESSHYDWFSLLSATTRPSNFLGRVTFLGGRKDGVCVWTRKESSLCSRLCLRMSRRFQDYYWNSFLDSTTGTGACMLWIDQQQHLKFNVDVVESERGQGANLDILAEKLAADNTHTIKAIFIVHHETATGVTNNLATVRKLLNHYRHQHYFSLTEFPLFVPLIFYRSASPKAIEASKTAKSVIRVFFDWNDYLKFYSDTVTAALVPRTSIVPTSLKGHGRDTI
ncbi:hypothetical protein V6N12_064464 [Hibiscus sabdariffa]|uniref:Uncharacterized protein n=1 Tax=Hibiscus sabdariffa TaxID=183260 RepID=A0ABR2G5W9_9ROSI